jgi:hypothetical protein
VLANGISAGSVAQCRPSGLASRVYGRNARQYEHVANFIPIVASVENALDEQCDGSRRCAGPRVYGAECLSAGSGVREVELFAVGSASERLDGLAQAQAGKFDAVDGAFAHAQTLRFPEMAHSLDVEAKQTRADHVGR